MVNRSGMLKRLHVTSITGWYSKLPPAGQQIKRHIHRKENRLPDLGPHYSSFLVKAQKKRQTFWRDKRMNRAPRSISPYVPVDDNNDDKPEQQQQYNRRRPQQRCWFRMPHVLMQWIWTQRHKRWLKDAQLYWCYRRTNTQDPWQPFEDKNQQILWQAYYLPTKQERQFRDRAFQNGKQLIHAVAKEFVAFSIEAGWTEPLVYDIGVCRATPPRTFWRRLLGKDPETVYV